MPFIQRNDSGEIVGRFANPQPGYAEEWIDDDSPALSYVSPAQIAAFERDWRDSQLLAVKWLRERHRDQQDIGGDTTLTAEQFKELLLYLQSLRDWPQSIDFPNDERRPLAPPWIAEQAQ